MTDAATAEKKPIDARTIVAMVIAWYAAAHLPPSLLELLPPGWENIASAGVVAAAAVGVNHFEWLFPFFRGNKSKGIEDAIAAALSNPVVIAAIRDATKTVDIRSLTNAVVTEIYNRRHPSTTSEKPSP